MIARIFFLLLLLIALPDLYIYWHYLKRRHFPAWKRYLYWFPCLVMLGWTLALASIGRFAPQQIEWLYIYLLLLGIFVIPKALFALCSVVGLGCCRLLHKRKNYGNLIGLLLGILAIYIIIYGNLIGFEKIEVSQIEYTSKDLPSSFDGYRIVQFSDAHVGSLMAYQRHILEKAIDSINAQKADAIIFTGDLINMEPAELEPVQGMLGNLNAPDGVFSILGNHDYSYYTNYDEATSALNERLLQSKIRSMGWTLLQNENRIIRRGKDSIVIAGVEDDSMVKKKEEVASRADYGKAMKGVGKQSFSIMLVHNPGFWRSDVLPKTNAQLTLSGHTHGGQLKFFGWSPVSITTDEWGGMYQDGNRSLYVSTGIGGLIPFRFGLPGEIVVITFRKAK